MPFNTPITQQAAARDFVACGELVYLNALALGDGRTLIPRHPVLYIADHDAAGYPTASNTRT